MQDNEKEFSILVDRSLGGSSIVDGQIELMLHRYVLSSMLISSWFICMLKGLVFHWCAQLRREILFKRMMDITAIFKGNL